MNLLDLANQAKKKAEEAWNSSKPYNVFANVPQIAQNAGQAIQQYQNSDSNILKRASEGTLPNTPQALKPAQQFVGSFLNNNVVNPILNAGVSATQFAQKPSVGNAFNTAIGALNATPAGVAYNSTINPLIRSATAGIQGLRTNQNPIKSAYQGVTGQKQVGLGDALTDNKMLAQIGNLAEIPLNIAGSKGVSALKQTPQVQRLIGAKTPMHPEDMQFLYTAMDNIKSKDPKLVQQGKNTLYNLAERYLDDKQLQKSNDNAQKLFGELTKYAESKPNVLGNFRMGIKAEKPVPNPQDPFFNVNRMGVGNDARQKVADTIQSPEVKQRIGDVVGGPMKFKDIQAKAQVTPELDKTFTGEQTSELGAQALALRNKLAEYANMGLDSEQYKEALVKDKAFGQYVARLLGQRRIESNPAQKSLFNEIISKVLKEGADPDEVAKAAKSVDFNDTKQAAEFYRKYVKVTPGDWADALRYNSMLSSPNTQINNAFGNLVGSSVVAPVEKTITGTLDFLNPVRRFKGEKQTQFAGEGLSYSAGYAKSLPTAAKRFFDSIKGKTADTNLDVRDIPMYTKGKKAAYEKVLKSPMRLLEATDQFFTALVEGGEKQSLKFRQSKGIPLSSTQIDEQAAKNAAYRLYRQDLGKNDGSVGLDAIDGVANLIQKARTHNNPVLRNIAKYTLPFLRTPTNILKQGIEYSPAGILTLPGAQNKTQQLSKAIIGSSAALATSMLVESGRVTWATPTGKKERDEFYAAGMQPYAVKVGDKWVSFTKLPPQLSFPIALVASIRDAEDKGKLNDSDVDHILAGVAKWGGFFADQSYLKQVGDIVSSIKGSYGANLSTVASNYAQQLIPFRALSSWINRLSDPYQRQVDRDASFWDQSVQELLQALPGGNGFVPMREDQYGMPVESNNNVFNAFSPLKTTIENPDKKQMYDTNKMLKKTESNIDDVVEMAKEGEDISGFLDKLVPEAQAEQSMQTVVPEFDLQKKAFEKQFMTAAKDIYAAPIPDAQKQKAIQNLGLEYKQVEYEVIKTLNDTDQAQYMASKLKSASDDQIKDWVKNEVLTTNVVSKMVNQGTITDLEAEALKELISPEQKKTQYTGTQLTGDPTIDKVIKSKTASEISTRKNEIVEDYAKGKISAEEAKAKIKELDMLGGNGGGRKLSISQGGKTKSIQPVTIKSNVSGINLPKAQGINIKSPGIKLSTPQRKISIKKPKIKKLSLKKS